MVLLMSLPVPCTIAAANAEFDRTVAYRTDLTGAMANDFITVCTWLQGRRASMSESAIRGDARFSTTYGDLELLMAQAQRWLAANVQSGAAFDIANIQNRAPIASQFGLCDIRGGGY